MGDIREALENEDRRTRAGKKDAVARFWQNLAVAIGTVRNSVREAGLVIG
ncbi:hypothetical protein [Mesorhizobium sp. M0809]